MGSSSNNFQGYQQTLTYEDEESIARSSPSIEDVHQRLSQLPDLVLSSLPSNSTQIRESNHSTTSRLTLCPPRVPPRKYKKKSKSDVVDGFSQDFRSKQPQACSQKTLTLPEQSWIRVGKELGNIADDFRSKYKEVRKLTVSLNKTELSEQIDI